LLSSLVDMDLEGGDAGGEVVAQGAPEQIARNPKSYRPIPQAGAGAEGEGRAPGGGVKRHSAWRTRTFRIYNRSFAGGLT
jgi:hypothetical protein